MTVLNEEIASLIVLDTLFESFVTRPPARPVDGDNDMMKNEEEYADHHDRQGHQTSSDEVAEGYSLLDHSTDFGNRRGGRLWRSLRCSTLLS